MATHVTTRSAGEPALWLTRARHHHVVSGASAERGGDGQALAAPELLLAALTTCAASIVADEAHSAGIHLHELTVSASSDKDPQAPGHYRDVTLHFVLRGTDAAGAEALVTHFRENCPIYGTLSRGAPLRITVDAQPA